MGKVSAFRVCESDVGVLSLLGYERSGLFLFAGWSMTVELARGGELSLATLALWHR